MQEVQDYFMGDYRNYTDSEKADQYVNMKSYMMFGYGIDKLMQFHVEKSTQPTYYLR